MLSHITRYIPILSLPVQVERVKVLTQTRINRVLDMFTDIVNGDSTNEIAIITNIAEILNEINLEYKVND